MDPLNEDPQLGDFLIRNLVGADHKQGILAVSDLLREGQTVQFPPEGRRERRPWT